MKTKIISLITLAVSLLANAQAAQIGWWLPDEPISVFTNTTVEFTTYLPGPCGDPYGCLKYYSYVKKQGGSDVFIRQVSVCNNGSTGDLISYTFASSGTYNFKYNWSASTCGPGNPSFNYSESSPAFTVINTPVPWNGLSGYAYTDTFWDGSVEFYSNWLGGFVIYPSTPTYIFSFAFGSFLHFSGTNQSQIWFWDGAKWFYTGNTVWPWCFDASDNQWKNYSQI